MGTKEIKTPAIEIHSVDEYITTHPDAVHAVLVSVRNAIRSAVPTAEECISYKMPTYKLRGGLVLHFAAWKNHYSIYPAGDTLVAAFKEELEPYKIENGTIRFPYTEAVPDDLIARIAKFRAGDITWRENS